MESQQWLMITCRKALSRLAPTHPPRLSLHFGRSHFFRLLKISKLDYFFMIALIANIQAAITSTQAMVAITSFIVAQKT